MQSGNDKDTTTNKRYRGADAEPGGQSSSQNPEPRWRRKVTRETSKRFRRITVLNQPEEHRPADVPAGNVQQDPDEKSPAAPTSMVSADAFEHHAQSSSQSSSSSPERGTPSYIQTAPTGMVSPDPFEHYAQRGSSRPERGTPSYIQPAPTGMVSPDPFEHYAQRGSSRPERGTPSYIQPAPTGVVSPDPFEHYAQRGSSRPERGTPSYVQPAPTGMVSPDPFEHYAQRGSSRPEKGTPSYVQPALMGLTTPDCCGEMNALESDLIIGEDFLLSQECTREFQEIDDHECSFDGIGDLEWSFDDGLLAYDTPLDKQSVAEQVNNGDCPLYNNAPISVAESLLLIMSFANRHKITGKALSDLIALVSIHCPSELQTECLKNLQKFKEFFDCSASSSISLHKYCNSCFMSVCNDTQCPACHAPVSEGSASYFIEVSVEAQLKSLFSKPGFEEKLNFRFSRKKKNCNNIEDIYDGELYQSFTQNGGPLSDPRNISFTWNTDGVPVFKSSKFSVWPFYCVINELCFLERTKRENMIFAGLWFGDSKPDMLTFLKPLCETLNKIERDGVLVQFAGKPEPFTCRVQTIAGTCDLPAKAMVLNSVQFNGHFGCLKCEQPGQTVKTGERGHVHAFPYQEADPKGPPRTHERFMNDARMAYETKSIVHGVKGPTWLGKLDSYNVIAGTGIDYMHAVLLGVMRLLMFLWFSSEFSRRPFSMAKSVHEIDRHIGEIQPPASVRYPRSIFSHRMYFKASEYRSMLLYFGPVVFWGTLGGVYYNHFLLLSEAMFILLMESITPAQIDHAERLLWNFCSQMRSLYGERYLTANVHLLVHLADSVRALGPLWTHSCFHFEDKNGHILSLIHGTQNIAMQMVNAVKLIQCLPSIATTINPDNVAAKMLTKMTGNDIWGAHVTKVMLIGASTDQSLGPDDLLAFEKCLGHSSHNVVKTFKRAQIGRAVYNSKQYVKDRRRNNNTVTFQDGMQIKYGQIDFFCSYQQRNYVFLNEYSRQGTRLMNDNVTHGTCFHIVSLVEIPLKRKVLPLENVLSKVVLMDLSSIPGIVFAAHLPNTLERD